jgi:hypothetical protein
MKPPSLVDQPRPHGCKHVGINLCRSLTPTRTRIDGGHKFKLSSGPTVGYRDTGTMAVTVTLALLSDL